jgi:hypothetical protein
MRADVALCAYGSTVAGVSVQGAIDDLEVGRILVQTHLKVEDWWPVYASEVFPEFDVEDAIGCCPCYRGEYPLTTSCVCCGEVVPVWSDQVDQVCGGQANVTEILSVSTRKLQVAV